MIALACCCLPYIDTIYLLLLFVPSLAVSFRRLHDINKSGWWFGVPVCCISVLALLAMTGPFISYDNPISFYQKYAIYSLFYIAAGLASFGVLLYTFVLFFFKGTKSSNKYGDKPNV